MHARPHPNSSFPAQTTAACCAPSWQRRSALRRNLPPSQPRDPTPPHRRGLLRLVGMGVGTRAGQGPGVFCCRRLQLTGWRVSVSSQPCSSTCCRCLCVSPSWPAANSMHSSWTLAAASGALAWAGLRTIPKTHHIPAIIHPTTQHLLLPNPGLQPWAAWTRVNRKHGHSDVRCADCGEGQNTFTNMLILSPRDFDFQGWSTR